MKLMFSILVFAILIACNKEPLPSPPPPTPPPISKLNIVWQVPIVPDTTEYSTSPCALVEGGIAFSSDFAVPTAFVQMREADSGAFRWKFDDFIAPIDGFTENQIFGLNDKVVINNWDRTYCVDAQSGNLDWAIDVGSTGNGEPFITTIGDYIYKANYIGQKPASTYESVVRAHYLLGSWDTLLTIRAEDSFYLNIYPPTLWINPQGDSVLLIRDNGLRDVTAGLYEGRLNLVNLSAWNMRTRQYEWKIWDFQDQRYIDINEQIVDGNLWYIHGFKNLYCINLLDGSLVWERALADANNNNNNIGFGNLVQHNNIIIVHGDDHGIWGINKANGATVWHNKTTIGTVVDMDYFDGVVYYVSRGSGLLYAINAQTGATIWAEYSRTKKPNATFGLSSVVIDPIRRVLYVADSYYMMCIKLPE